MLPTYGRTHDAHPLLKTFYLPHMQCGQIIFDVKPLARPPCAVKVLWISIYCNSLEILMNTKLSSMVWQKLKRYLVKTSIASLERISTYSASFLMVIRLLHRYKRKLAGKLNVFPCFLMQHIQTTIWRSLFWCRIQHSFCAPGNKNPTESSPSIVISFS